MTEGTGESTSVGRARRAGVWWIVGVVIAIFVAAAAFVLSSVRFGAVTADVPDLPGATVWVRSVLHGDVEGGGLSADTQQVRILFGANTYYPEWPVVSSTLKASVGRGGGAEQLSRQSVEGRVSYIATESKLNILRLRREASVAILTFELTGEFVQEGGFRWWRLRRVVEPSAKRE